MLNVLGEQALLTDDVPPAAPPEGKVHGDLGLGFCSVNSELNYTTALLDPKIPESCSDDPIREEDCEIAEITDVYKFRQLLQIDAAASFGFNVIGGSVAAHFYHEVKIDEDFYNIGARMNVQASRQLFTHPKFSDSALEKLGFKDKSIFLKAHGDN